MQLTDYMARVEQAVRENVQGEVLAAIRVTKHEISYEDYWERVYVVAWQREDQSGTHRVHINSKDESSLFMGNYMLTPTDALHDAVERAGLTVGRV